MDILSLYPTWILTHGAALIVVLPLLAGAIAAILPSRHFAWGTTLLVTLICVGIAFALVLQIFGGDTIHYKLGGWDPPHGIAYVVDGLNAPVLLLISAMALLCTVYGLPTISAEVEPKKRAPFYAAFLICIAGLLGMVITGDAFNVFVFLEVSSISTYSLVAMGASRDRRALSAAYNYLIMGSIGATFFVIGLGFLYMETGTLNIADMGRILRDIDGGSRVSQVAFGFIIVGLGLKLAMFPLHTWLPGAYAQSPTLVTVFLASTATKAALYLMLRFAFTVFDIGFDYVLLVVSYMLAGLGVLGMLLGSLQAIFQTDVRRTLAFSSVAQVGYMLLGIGLGTRTSDFNGLAKTMPWTMGGFTLGGLSLIGVPFTAGFVSKWRLVEAAAESGWWWAVSIIVVSSVLAIIYIGRIILAAYFQPPPDVNGEVVAKNEAPLTMLIPMWGLGLMSVMIGVNADMVVSAAEGAAAVLLPAITGAGS